MLQDKDKTKAQLISELMELRRQVSADHAERQQAEEQLAREQALLNSLIDSISDTIFYKDANGVYLGGNAAFFEFSARDVGEIVGRTDTDIYHPKLAERFLETDRQILASGKALRYKDWTTNPDGEKVLIETHKAPYYGPEGEVIGVIGVGRDITEYKRAEEAARESEERYRRLVEYSPDGIAVHGEGKIIYINPAGAKLVGAAGPEELIGKSLLELVHPYYGESLKGLVRKSPAEGNQIGLTEDKLIRRDGKAVDVEISATPIIYQGKPAMQAIIRDVTERKQAEEALRKAHAEIEQLVNSISSLLIGLSPDRHITQWNSTAEALFGLAAAEVLGLPLSEVGVQWQWDPVLESISKCEESNHPIHLDPIRFRRIDGSEGFLGINISPINNEDVLSKYILMGADITERITLERRLTQAEKLEAIGQLAAGIAHEINTPTQYVGDNTRFLQDSFADIVLLLRKYDALMEVARQGNLSPELLAEIETAAEKADVKYLFEEIPLAIQQSLEGINRVSEIVRAMKKFSHPGVTEKTMIDLNESIESTIVVARNEWKYVAEMVTDFDPQLPLILCLPGDFNQVILNLVTNAAHAIADVVGDGSGGKGKITVSTRRAGNWAEVRVSDTGSGIPEEIQARIFDPFFTTKEVGRGTGQGLSISHSVIVEKHGGTISFETEVGRGTTFLIRLPIEPDVNHE